MKKTKRIWLCIIAVVFLLSVAAAIFYTQSTDTMQERQPAIDAVTIEMPEGHRIVYKPDGTTKEVLKSEVDTYLQDGWYDVPVITIYNTNDETKVIEKSDYENYQEQGFYTAPVTIVYNADEEYMVIYKTELETYLQQNWYTAPVTTVYTLDNRSMLIYQTELESYLASGWYQTPEEVPGYAPAANKKGAETAIKPGAKLVALTFDDGPGKYTDEILDCLVENDSKATFFVLGSRAKSNPKTLKRTYELGMEIGNHTMDHKVLKNLDAAGVTNQLNNASTHIIAATGAAPTLIRPPYGSYNATVKSVANAPLILWSVDTLDWKTRNADATVNTILNEVKDGSIVLLHDIHAPTLEAVKRVVPELIARGYQLVTVSELAAAKGVTLEPGKAYGSIK